MVWLGQAVLCPDPTFSWDGETCLTACFPLSQ